MGKRLLKLKVELPPLKGSAIHLVGTKSFASVKGTELKNLKGDMVMALLARDIARRNWVIKLEKVKLLNVYHHPANSCLSLCCLLC